jgi:hypothetical protein
LQQQKTKPKSLPIHNFQKQKEFKLKKNNYFENRNKFAAQISGQNVKKMGQH